MQEWNVKKERGKYKKGDGLLWGLYNLWSTETLIKDLLPLGALEKEFCFGPVLNVKDISSKKSLRAIRRTKLEVN